MRQAERAKDATNESREVSQDGGSAVSALGTMEEDLTESLNDLSALPIDWESRPAGEVLSTDVAKSDDPQPAAAHP